MGYTTWTWLYVNHYSPDETIPNDPFVLKIETEDGGSLQADAGTMFIGKEKAAGLGRYIVSHRPHLYSLTDIGFSSYISSYISALSSLSHAQHARLQFDPLFPHIFRFLDSYSNRDGSRRIF